MLSVEDRLAIEQLYARYNLATDTDDTESLIRCFTPDGRFKGLLEEVQGHDAMRQQAVERAERKSAQGHTNHQHWNGSFVLEGDSAAGRASGLCYMLFVAKVPDAHEFTIRVMGAYVDELVKKEGRWLFTSRRITFDTPIANEIPLPS
jgi:hypothetical protein